jgi:hypothetical protein
VYGAESLRESAHPAGSFCSGREVAPQIRLAGGRDRLAPLGGVPGGGLTQLTCRGVVVANRTTRDRSRHLGPALDEPATNGGDHSVAGRGCHVVKVAVGKVAGERGDLDRTTGGLGGCCWATQEKCGANQGKRGCSRDEPAASRCCHGWSLRFGTVRNLFGAASNIAAPGARVKSPASSASLRAVRELAAVVLVLVKAVEGVVDVLGHQRVQAAPAPSRYGYRNSYGFDDEDEQR